jgi:integrase
MVGFDPVQTWIGNVAYSHSHSEGTADYYKFALKNFCSFIEKTPEQILEEYEISNEKGFRRKYARLLKAFIIEQTDNDYAVGSITTIVAAIRSFFKYNDLPLGYVPTAKNRVTYHNRDIKLEEIKKILVTGTPRDRAFYSLMIQSGLRPHTITQLEMKHLESDFSKGIIPCMIRVPEEISKGGFGAYFTFIGPETIKYLKAYLSTRPNTRPEDYVFVNRSGRQLSRRSITNIFARTIEGMKKKGTLSFEQKKLGKPRTLRLYNLRKFFRNCAAQAGVEYVNFWMGHKTNYKTAHIPASEVHYFSREDVEFQRELYREKAMPHLRIETSTPTETDKTIRNLEEKIEKLEQENLVLKQKLNDFTLDSEQVKELLRRIEKLEKMVK